MGKKKTVKKKAVPDFKLGDYVRIHHSAFPYGRIVELRGPLGVHGEQIYDVRIYGTQVPMYVELPGEFFELIPPEELTALKEQVAAREARDRAIAALSEDE